MCRKGSYALSAVIVLTIAVVMFFPATGTAGSLEPSAAPAPTMKTLDQIPPTWSIKIPGADRFVVLADFNNEAVLDKETGLVWEQSPNVSTLDWISAMYACPNKRVGNRKGWLLPTVDELGSLVDPTITYPALPSGHPFNNVQQDHYWSATTSAYDATQAWVVNFINSYVNIDPKANSYYVWCVRGGQSHDAY